MFSMGGACESDIWLPRGSCNPQVKNHTTLDYLDSMLFFGHMNVSRDTVSTKGMNAAQKEHPINVSMAKPEESTEAPRMLLALLQT